MVDPETEARVLLERAGLGSSDVPGPVAIALALGIAVRRFDGQLLRGADGMLFWPRGRSQPAEVAVRRGLPRERLVWVVAHELAELRLAELDYRESDAELAADAIAAALVMPRAAFGAVAGLPLPRLAASFGADQTAAALRLGEVGRVEAAVVVAPGRIYARARDPFMLPPEPELRRAARSGHPGLRRVVLTDARKRVALLAG